VLLPLLDLGQHVVGDGQDPSRATLSARSVRQMALLLAHAHAVREHSDDMIVETWSQPALMVAHQLRL
jgi:hypothetical protein